jgi:hypothetical protein
MEKKDTRARASEGDKRHLELRVRMLKVGGEGEEQAHTEVQVRRA